MKKRTKHKRLRRRGRPSIHEETWSKVSVVLFDRQVRRLDDLVHRIRKSSRSKISRATIVRALIDGLLRSRLDVTDTPTEAQLVASIARRLARA